MNETGGKRKSWQRPEILLLLMAMGVPLSFATWNALINNFAIERAAFSGAEMGVLQSLREVPGFLAFSVIFVLLLVREQSLPTPLLQLAVLITARSWSAQYAWSKRVKPCLQAGIRQGVIDAVRERRRPSFESDDQEAVYDYVTQLLETSRVGDATHLRLQRIIGDDCLIELVTAVGFYSMLGLLCDAFEPDLPAGVDAALAD